METLRGEEKSGLNQIKYPTKRISSMYFLFGRTFGFFISHDFNQSHIFHDHKDKVLELLEKGSER
jgi:hypothetical protein